METKDALEALRRRWHAQPLAKATRNPGFVCYLVVHENSMGHLALGMSLTICCGIHCTWMNVEWMSWNVLNHSLLMSLLGHGSGVQGSIPPLLEV